jgi:superfamily II DNA or RNA helicase
MAIRKFMERPLRDSGQAKRLSVRKARRLLARLDPPPEFKHPPYHHQRICFLLGVKYPQYMFLLDMGLGKTKITLDLFAWRKRAGICSRLLVIVPKSANVTTWEDQIAEHTPWLSCAALDDSLLGVDRAAAVEGEADIVVMTIAGLLHLVCEKVQSKRKGKKNEMALSDRRIKWFASQFDMVTYDETTFFRTHGKLPFKAAKKLQKFIHYRYGLTGTPFGKNPEHLWPQFFMVDRGRTLGPTLGLFREAFFTKIRNHWSGWWDYRFNKRKDQALHRMLRHGSIRYAESECFDMPKLIISSHPVIFPAETWDYYEKLIEEMRNAERSFKAIDSAYIRARQLASGFLGARDPEGRKIEVVFKENPKLDALQGLLEEIPEDRKVLIFHCFIPSAGLISDRLKQMKITHAVINGTITSGKKRKDALHRFQKDPKCRAMVINVDSGAFGLNLQAATVEIFYEMPDDPIVYRQAIKRAHRGGQQHNVHAHHLMVRASIEEKQFRYLQEGKSLFDAVIEGREMI